MDDWDDGRQGGEARRRTTAVVGNYAAADKTAFLTRLETAWHSIGDAWRRLLEGMALAHNGHVVALFQDHLPGVPRELQKLFGSALMPCARLHTPEADWTCGLVPAMLRLFFRDGDRGLVGVVTSEERVYQFDLDRCALLLRNLAVSVGAQELAETVLPQPASVRSCSPWRLGDFGTRRDRRITVENLTAALLAAYHGAELQN